MEIIATPGHPHILLSPTNHLGELGLGDPPRELVDTLVIPLQMSLNHAAVPEGLTRVPDKWFHITIGREGSPQTYSRTSDRVRLGPLVFLGAELTQYSVRLKISINGIDQLKNEFNVSGTETPYVTIAYANSPCAVETAADWVTSASVVNPLEPIRIEHRRTGGNLGPFVYKVIESWPI